MEILSTAIDGGNPGNIMLLFESAKPILVNYVIPAILALGVIKIIQVVSRNMKEYFDKIKGEDTELSIRSKSKHQA